jgi:hypothetical protein
MTIHTALANQRIYFVDGPAAGRSQRTDRPTLRLSWDDELGNAHGYRRLANFRGSHFYREDR